MMMRGGWFVIVWRVRDDERGMVLFIVWRVRDVGREGIRRDSGGLIL